MYELVRQRPGNSSKAVGVSVAVLVTALVGFALSSGLALRIVETLTTKTTVVVVAKEEPEVDPEPRREFDTSVNIDRPDPVVPDFPVFATGDSPIYAGNIEPGTGRGDGLSGLGGGAAPPAPLRKRAVLISGDEPVFPTASYRAGEQGTTGLAVCLNEKGRVTSAAVANSSGFTRLDEATLTWVKRARFRPATVDGRPEAVCGHRIDYVWKYEVLCGDSPDTLKPCPRRAR